MKVINTVPFELWDRIANLCPYATFFHTSQWARFLRKNSPLYRIATKAFHFGKDDWVVFPMMQSLDDMKGFFSSFYANVPGVYGGLIANHPLSAERVEKIISYMKGIRTKKIEIFGNPFCDMSWPAASGEISPNFTHVLKLSAFATEEDVLNHYTRGVRKAVKRAMELGYRHRPIETEADVHAYYHVYCKALERYGDNATGQKPFSFFINLYYNRGSNIQLWAVEKNARLIGGMICFTHNKHFIVWHAAFLDDEFEGGVAKFIHHRIIMEAKKKNFEIYDFNPSGGHEGTAIFKDRFSAERKTFQGLRWTNNKIFHAYQFLRSPAANLSKLKLLPFYPEFLKSFVALKEKRMS